MDDHYYDNVLKTVAYQSLKSVLGVVSIHLAIIWLAALIGASLGTFEALQSYGALLLFYYGWILFFTGLGIIVLTIQMGCVLAHLIYIDKIHVEWLFPTQFAITLTAAMCISGHLASGSL